MSSKDGSGEMELEISLDEIIKLNRIAMMQSPVTEPECAQGARQAIRRSAASRTRQRKRGNVFLKPVASSMKSRLRKEMPRRSGLPRRPLVPGDEVTVYDGAAGKLKVSVVNENAKPINWENGRRNEYDNLEMHFPPRVPAPAARHRTLDSLFARIKEERELGRPPAHAARYDRRR